MTKTRKDYNYRQFSILFDLDVEEDRVMMEWLETHKAKRNSFCVLIKRALKSYIEKGNKEWVACYSALIGVKY